MLEKTCPKCETVVNRTTRTCSCGHVFSAKKRKARTAKAAPIDETPSDRNPDFACGPTSDGGLLLYWPSKQEAVVLTKAERELIDAACSRAPVEAVA